ncbi:hypothetical protein [Halomarina pelagica]|uniref:hypothetical protein n=1 Tax=Halomarina pelagica TaxID=2961599 RepID=UPI0020C52AD4|nr:hypothetical protein [Halomarina sp. BND7]
MTDSPADDERDPAVSLAADRRFDPILVEGVVREGGKRRRAEGRSTRGTSE